MAVQQTMVGSRAVVYISGVPIGWFASCTWNATMGGMAIHTLGKPYPREIAITHAEPVTLQIGGYKPIAGTEAGSNYLGPFQAIGVNEYLIPSVADINAFFSNSDHTLAIHDAINTENILFEVVGFRALGHSSGFNAKGVQEIQINGSGIAMIDDSAGNDESLLPTPGDFST